MKGENLATNKWFEGAPNQHIKGMSIYPVEIKFSKSGKTFEINAILTIDDYSLVYDSMEAYDINANAPYKELDKMPDTINMQKTFKNIFEHRGVVGSSEL